VSTEVVLVIALVALVIGLAASALLLVLARRLATGRVEPRLDAPTPPVAIARDSVNERHWDQREQELMTPPAELAEQRDTLGRRER